MEFSADGDWTQPHIKREKEWEMTGLPLIFCSLVLGTYKINNYSSHQRDTNFGGANSRSAKMSPRYSACRISNEPGSVLQDQQWTCLSLLLLTDTDLQNHLAQNSLVLTLAEGCKGLPEEAFRAGNILLICLCSRQGIAAQPHLVAL